MSIQCAPYFSIYRVSEYGLFYNWFAAANSNIAPSGWHVPTLTEFDTLISFLGGESVAGQAMNESGFEYWQKVPIHLGYTGGTNSSGLSIYGADGRIYQEGFNYYLGQYSYLWTKTEADATQGADIRTYYYNSTVNTSTDRKESGKSIRLIRDSAVGWVEGEQLVDYDNNIYDTVEVGTQIWTVQNFASTHYNNGVVIPEIISTTDWELQTTGALCSYLNNWINVFI
jgi:uncharacterized protein (TIGR02145 family)